MIILLLKIVNQFGIDVGRLTPNGVGLFVPIASNRTEDGRALSRRVEPREF